MSQRWLGWRDVTSSAAAAPRLDWRARHRPIGAINTAVAGFRFQSATARRTFPEELARIRRHPLLLLETALRTSDDRNILNLRSPPRPNDVPDSGSDQCRHPAVSETDAGQRVVIREHRHRTTRRDHKRSDATMPSESEKSPDDRRHNARLNHVVELRRESLEECQAQGGANGSEQRKTARHRRGGQNGVGRANLIKRWKKPHANRSHDRACSSRIATQIMPRARGRAHRPYRTS